LKTVTVVLGQTTISWRRTAGFSLIEALAATALAVIGLLGMSASSVMLARASKASDMTAAATALTVERLELLRSMPLGSSGHTPGTYSGGALEANGATGGPFNVAWVVSANDQPTFGLKRVTVTTSWTQQGKARQVRHAALVRCSKTPC
jgi:Tfp pilus assembly protein PilV